ncbi:hypothetical protein TNCV_1361591 [Trichonephila clavipes]|nr:hypothetical protein TNCV_1361591 [Trichonephila clavipes]
MNFEGYFLGIDWPFGGITLGFEYPTAVLLLHKVSSPNEFPESCPLLVRWIDGIEEDLLVLRIKNWRTHTLASGRLAGKGFLRRPRIILGYRATEEGRKIGVSLQTDHLIETFAHAPQRPMVNVY